MNMTVKMLKTQVGPPVYKHHDGTLSVMAKVGDEVEIMDKNYEKWMIDRGDAVPVNKTDKTKKETTTTKQSYEIPENPENQEIDWSKTETEDS